MPRRHVFPILRLTWILHLPLIASPQGFSLTLTFGETLFPYTVGSVFTPYQIMLYLLYADLPETKTKYKWNVKCEKMQMTRTQKSLKFPAGTWRLYNVGSTSVQRLDVASTLSRRCINVMCPLGCFLKRFCLIHIYDLDTISMDMQE